MEDEKWLPVPGYETWYEVSDWGRVRSLDRVKRVAVGPYVLKGRVLTTLPDKRGYQRVTLYLPIGDDHIRRSRGFFVHRLVAMAHIRMPLPHETDVNHKDLNPASNMVKNLEWCSRKENMEHASVNGALHGEAGGRRVRLTQATVDQIRAIGAEGKTPQHAIATMFSIRQADVSRILLGQRWAYGDSRNVPVTTPGKKVRTTLNTKLTEDSVRNIKSIGRSKSIRELGAMFNVSPNCIQEIRSGKSWKDII